MVHMTRTKRATEAEIGRVLRALRALPRDARDRRTTLLRDLGEATADFREHFLTGEGNPDWAGRTGAYRAAIQDLYSDAGYSADEARAVQKVTRYHVANTLRERLSADDIADLGLRAETPRERQTEIRERNAAILAATAAADATKTKTAADNLHSLRDTLSTLTHMRLRLDHDGPDTTEAAARTLRAIVDRASDLLRSLG